MKKILIITSYLIFLSIITEAKAPMKFGNIDIEDLKATTYENDTSAVAVVLCDYGVFDANQFHYLRNIRIKILKPEGFDWAEFTFNTYEKSKIRGITYNLVDGKIVESRLKNSDIHKERVTENNYRMNVAMPDVKVGSIVDIQYAKNRFPSKWFFQKNIPVRHSELLVKNVDYYDYRVSYSGTVPLDKSTHTHWIATNVPSFKSEPYINSRNNYIANIKFELVLISIPGYRSREYATNWENVKNYFYNHTYFSQALASHASFREEAKRLRESNLPDIEKIKQAYEWVKRIKWNNQIALFTEYDALNIPIKEAIGNSADINHTLVKLLKKAKVTAAPVALSTVKNGIVNPYHPTIDKYNYTIAAAITNENDTILMDATEKYAPINLLPTRCLNWNGFMIDKTNWGVIPILTKKINKKYVVYNLNLDQEGVLKGNINLVNQQYAALNFRKYYHSFNSETEFLEDYIENKPGLKINKSEFTDINNIEKAAVAKFQVEIENQTEAFDDEIFIYPLLYEKMKEHPFKDEERKYPISFITKSEKNIVVNLKIPDGYEVAEIPKPKSIRLPQNAAMFSYQVNVNGNMIIINCRHKINTNILPQNLYPYIREFYNQLLAKHNEPIILIKSN